MFFRCCCYCFIVDAVVAVVAILRSSRHSCRCGFVVVVISVVVILFADVDVG